MKNNFSTSISYMSYIFVILLLFINSVSLQSTPQIKVAVLATAGPEDLGFNYQVNKAKVNAEKLLQLRDVYYYSGIPINESQAFIENLCNTGFNVIIVSTLDYGVQAKAAAKTVCQNVQFLTRGSSAVTTNVQSVTYNFISANYVTGYFAGLMTKTNVLGYICPGPPNSYASNAFYVGAKNSNPNVTMYYYSTGSWLNPDLSTGAAKSLLTEYNVDVIGQTQDDMAASIEAVNMGFIGLGTNGLDQRDIFGEKIALSYVMDWTQSFVDLINKTMNSTPMGNFTHTNYYGDWENNFLTYTVSKAVSQEVIDTLDAIILNFTTVTKDKAPFFCNDYNQFLFRPENITGGNCVKQTLFQNMTDPYPGMTWLGNYSIPLTLREVPRQFTVAFTASCGGLILLSGVLALIVWLYRDRAIIRSASPIFCILIIFGGMIVFGGIILWTVKPTTATCNARIWLVSLGFSTLIGSLVVKNFRIWLIFDNPELKTIKITNYQLFPWVAALLLINALLMGIMSGAGDLLMETQMGIDDLGLYEYMEVCTMNNTGSIALYILLAYFAVLLLVGVFVSWKIRIVDIAEFNESKPIANTLYAISFSVFIIVSLVVSPQYYQDENIVLCVAGIFMATAALGIIFIPKVYGLFSREATTSDQLFSMKKSSIASSRSSASKNASNSKNSSNPDQSGNSSGNINNYYKKSNNNVLAEFTDEDISVTNSDQQNIDNEQNNNNNDENNSNHV